MAQAYNHTIPPFSNHRDKVTQVRWGIADFEQRFGRRPEGMWLPETAVDTESLDILARAGIRFTVLYRTRPLRSKTTMDCGRTSTRSMLETRVPYLIDLGQGRSIVVFFYDGPLSREIAFDGLLKDGTALAHRLVAAVGEPVEEPRLGHVATDRAEHLWAPSPTR